MLWKKFIYRWLDLTDWVQNDIVLIDSVRNIPLRTGINDRANFHWTYTSSSLAWGRIFIFRWQVFGKTKAERRAGRKKLIDVIQPEYSPTDINRGFYDLTRETDWGVEMTTKAKVYQAPEANNWLDDPVIEFSFALYSETEKVYSPTTKTANWWIGYFMGTPLPTTLPTPLSWYVGSIECNNEWNWIAPIRVNVVWDCTNVKIINLTNSQKYKLWQSWDDFNSTNLIYDNRNLTNDPTKILVVQDQWTSVKQYRTQGWDIFLNPWINNIVVLTDNYPNDADVIITWRDAYFLT